MGLHGRKSIILSLKKGKRKYILETDVEHPKELRKNHNELP